MRAEFFRTDKPEEVVAVAAWDGRGASIQTSDESVRLMVERIFRATPVTREPGEGGVRKAPAVMEPGDLDWFRTAAVTRGGREGLAVRFVSETPGGWDPAGTYRSMGAWVADRETIGPG